MALGATSYASVTWTTGDVITEAKLDNMVANDQAYDSHASNGILINNDTGLYEKNSAGVNTQLLNLNADDELELGSAGIQLNMLSDWDGWQGASEVWTRTGNHSFTIPTDVTAKYRKGSYVRYKDGGSFEYGVIASSSYSSPNTTVELIPNTDYLMAPATITDTGISYVANPEGFPSWFDYNSTSSGTGSMTVSQTSLPYAKFAVTNGVVNVLLNAVHTTGGSASDSIIMTLPTSQSADSFNWAVGCRVLDGSGIAGYARSAGSNTIAFYRYDGSNYGLGPNRIIAVSFAYQM